jgi:hypothetical protein
MSCEAGGFVGRAWASIRQRRVKYGLGLQQLFLRRIKGMAWWSGLGGEAAVWTFGPHDIGQHGFLLPVDVKSFGDCRISTPISRSTNLSSQSRQLWPFLTKDIFGYDFNLMMIWRFEEAETTRDGTDWFSAPTTAQSPPSLSSISSA